MKLIVNWDFLNNLIYNSDLFDELQSSQGENLFITIWLYLWKNTCFSIFFARLKVWIDAYSKDSQTERQELMERTV
jgi:hypothetical protein